MDKISIITTFYNAKEFIEHTLNSILKQKTDKTFEIEYVLVDDHSPHSSREIVEEFMRTHTLNGDWRLITPEENLGCGGARRYGIEHATGDYFMFLDADDYYINPDFVHIMNNGKIVKTGNMDLAFDTEKHGYHERG